MTPLPPEPDQPDPSSWKFVEELKTPANRVFRWTRTTPHENEANLSLGVQLKWTFPDPSGLLVTAYDSLQRLLQSASLPTDGPFQIITAQAPTDLPESYRVILAYSSCTVEANDTEGIRRGIFWLENQLLGADGPFLPIGSVERKPVIRTRLSRCFFGPILRPPHNRDELTDDVDYYPDAYLDRLAHDGVNGLWLTLRFRDVCRTRFFPDHGHDAERRLAKLRRTVEKCARHGIRIFPFCIEPRAFGPAEYNAPISELEAHPELAGHRGWLDGVQFCTSTEAGQAYLEEATRSLFGAVPDLGGLIMINLGERPTHCYSALPLFFTTNCPRCGQRAPSAVFRNTLAALARGMHSQNPSAELISWLYVPTLLQRGGGDNPLPYEQTLRDICAQAPGEVIMQMNFESGGVTKDLAGPHIITDYSLAYIGPSPVFADCAASAVEGGARMSAKLQVGCSHEVATVPFVPVPGHLFQKYLAMHALGVSAATQCWYFGNYPSPMTQAAGELSFAPLPETESEFLAALARPSWGKDAETVALAWQRFQAAYSHFPKGSTFSYFGPVHDAIVWPLYLYPTDSLLARSWKLDPPSGDRIGECIGQEYTLEETRKLCGRMLVDWEQGLQFLRTVRLKYENVVERVAEVGVAEALGLQIRSAVNVLSFYAKREALPYAEESGQRSLLAELETVVREEIRNCESLAVLAEADSRLGFHSEAEGYKYFPANLRWRAQQLQSLLESDFPKLRSEIEAKTPLFASYTGHSPEGPAYHCPGISQVPNESFWDDAPIALCGQVSPETATEHLQEWKTTWQAGWDRVGLHVKITCQNPRGKSPVPAGVLLFEREHVQLSIEPRRLWPAVHLSTDEAGNGYCERVRSTPDAAWTVQTQTLGHGWNAHFRIPWEDLGERSAAPERLRINIRRVLANKNVLSWVTLHPVPLRLYCLGTYNPRDLGWLFLRNPAAETPITDHSAKTQI